MQLELIKAVGPSVSTVQVNTTVGPITIIEAYCPQQANLTDQSSAALKQDLRKLTRRREQFILASELNPRLEAWENSRRNKNGIILQQDLDKGDYTIMFPNAPIRLSQSGAHSILVVFLTNMADNISQPFVHQVLSTNRFPVLAVKLGP